MYEWALVKSKWAHEEMFNIINQHENANGNHSEIHTATLKNS